MGMTSAAEQKLNARIRPDVTAMRTRTPYPKRRLSVVPPVGAGSPDTEQPRPASSRREVPQGPVRLTRRGRIVAGALVVITALVAASLIWLLAGGQAVAADHVQSGHVTSQVLRKVVVRPGQTLWGIAVAADPTADPRAVIQQIVEENELTGTTIQAGQVLWVPRA